MENIGNGTQYIDQLTKSKELLRRFGRFTLRRYSSLQLRGAADFDEYEELGVGLCDKITSHLNSTVLQSQGFVFVFDFPFAIGDDRTRMQILTNRVYLREIDPMNPLSEIKDFQVGPNISVRLARPQNPNLMGALEFQTMANYGRDVLYTISANEEADPKRRFGIVVHQDKASVLLLDFKTPNEAGRPLWRVNHRLFY